MSVRKLLPAALVLAVVSIRCAGSPAEPIGTVSVTQTTTTTTTTVIPDVRAGAATASPGGTGVAGATLYSFTVQPSGGVPPYTVQWNFGDGGTGSGPSASHVFATPGTFTAQATVSDSRGLNSQASVGVSVRSVIGTWSVAFTGGTANPARESMDLVQNGAAVTATINDTANAFGLGSGSGNVSNPRTLAVNATFPAAIIPPATTAAPFAATLIGTLDTTVTQWTGTASGYPGCPCTFTATRVDVPGVLSVPRR
jgi:PKD repeat protein